MPSALAKPFAPVAAYLRHSAAPVQSAALTLPLLVLYGLGVLLVPEARNGVDFLSDWLMLAFASLGPMRWAGYLTFYGGLIIVNLALLVWLGKKNHFDRKYFPALLLESALYAVVTGSVSSSIVTDLANLLPQTVPLSAGPRQYGPIAGVIVSAGAGLHEELVFRLVGIGAVARVWLGAQWLRPSLKLVGLVLASSVLFSLAHHIVEPFHFLTFVYRTVAGLLFAILYLVRGFAVAAWTHALYDVWVIVVLGL